MTGAVCHAAPPHLAWTAIVNHLPPHPDWIVPDWPAPARVRALCTTRRGGVSAAPFDSLNLGLSTGDRPAAVAANWAAVEAALHGGRAGAAVRPVRLDQVHGTRVLQLGPGTQERQPADAAATRASGIACVALAADCLPVLLADRAGTQVAAAHAGWRGLAAGVLDNAVACFSALDRENKGLLAIENGALGGDEVLAWIGPGIGPQAFEVGPEVRAAFLAHDPAAALHFQAAAGGKYWADLAGLARQRLRAAGVRHIHGNDGSLAWCTFANASRFFSYRRDHAALGGTGRMAALVWLAD
ncbi:conserved hypothetical protein [Oryzisolibacter propanilivorax]|uniref:Purine nucleoside phosphorylase n=1 Tax=Oryzisolibacter propanilivorax TaxID=1527607 RepID=A0A1G9PHS2_9BURK|nr:conserved hypothetical protein [Oryzisolibacter propanilivorax]